MKQPHRRRKVLNIERRGGGGARFKILGGQGVAKLFAGCKLIGAPLSQSVPNYYISHWKTDDIAKLRIEWKSILSKIPSNKIKGTYLKLVHM